MFKEYKPNDLITIKLSNGEELLCKFLSTNEGYVEVEKGLVLMQGPQGIALGTFFSTANPEKAIKIASNNITAIAEINPKLKDQYNNVFSKIKTTAKPNIIV
jgi:hypothetical protein|tara:strand:+ start:290 stop:595 length:306 start_codon:yes stop_codon:yes gene_type:complete